MLKDLVKKRGIIALIILIFLIFCSSALFFFIKPSTQSLLSKKSAQRTGSDLPHNERQVVTTYNQAMLKQDWAQVYTLSSHVSVGGFTQGQFVQLMKQQSGTQGVITSIQIISDPQRDINPDGTPYFTVQGKVTKMQNGTIHNDVMASTFIWEDGAWKFLSSKKVLQ